MTFSIDGLDHQTGTIPCPDCWDNRIWPRPCKCGGLIHAQFGDENYDGDYWLAHRCDKCDHKYEEMDKDP